MDFWTSKRLSINHRKADNFKSVMSLVERNVDGQNCVVPSYVHRPVQCTSETEGTLALYSCRHTTYLPNFWFLIWLFHDKEGLENRMRLHKNMNIAPLCLD